MRAARWTAAGGGRRAPGRRRWSLACMRRRRQRSGRGLGGRRGLRGVEERVIDVTPGVAAVHRGTVGLVERRTGGEALRQVGVGEELDRERRRIALVVAQRGLGAV